jgi:hypothetical protein
VEDDDFSARLDLERTDPRGVSRRLRLAMYRGDSKSFTRQVLFNATTDEYRTIAPALEQVPSGFAALNLTGWRVWFTVKYHYPDPDQSAVMQLDNLSLGGIVIATPATGVLVATTPPIATRLFPDSDMALVCDLQGKDASANIRTFDSGILVVSPDITNAIG